MDLDEAPPSIESVTSSSSGPQVEPDLSSLKPSTVTHFQGSSKTSSTHVSGLGKQGDVPKAVTPIACTNCQKAKAKVCHVFRCKVQHLSVARSCNADLNWKLVRWRTTNLWPLCYTSSARELPLRSAFQNIERRNNPRKSVLEQASPNTYRTTGPEGVTCNESAVAGHWSNNGSEFKPFREAKGCPATILDRRLSKLQASLSPYSTLFYLDTSCSCPIGPKEFPEQF